MNFKPSRSFAIEKLNKFIDQELINYSRLRNFDYGKNNRSNISKISKDTTHRILNEYEIIKKSKLTTFIERKILQTVIMQPQVLYI